MKENQAYLDENISISQIAEKLGILNHHLSMTINIEFGLNFYNYINKHRIMHAELLLKNPKEKEESVLMIAYRSGFQSKRSFNKAFKLKETTLENNPKNIKNYCYYFMKILGTYLISVHILHPCSWNCIIC